MRIILSITVVLCFYAGVASAEPSLSSSFTRVGVHRAASRLAGPRDADYQNAKNTADEIAEEFCNEQDVPEGYKQCGSDVVEGPTSANSKLCDKVPHQSMAIIACPYKCKFYPEDEACPEEENTSLVDPTLFD
ncbi:MAG: hypothetical protein H6619_06760 [Deltaproteobacteria bacterium]|nr:hypothetical protein [Deltaproteobacteria bacterium]